MSYTRKSHSDREIICGALSDAIDSVRPDKVLKNRIRIKKGSLSITGLRRPYDIAKFDKIIVVGGGKASGYLAESLEKILGSEAIDSGFINILKGTKRLFHTSKIELNEASHPVPDTAGVEGVRRMLELLRKATANSLVICLISGGGSSLLPLPTKGVSLEDLVETTELLLKAGAKIEEINAVRKHISAIKGGRLIEHTNGAQVLTFLISDVVGDNLDSIASGPTVPDSTTFADALKVLSSFNLLAKVPRSVRLVLKQGNRGIIQETPKPGSKIFQKVENVIIANNRIACESALNYLIRRLGRNAVLNYLGSTLQGEASVIGAKLARTFYNTQLQDSDRKRKRGPRAFVWGGETTVTVKGSGVGGRNQEQALAALIALGKLGFETGLTMAFMGTDGVDGRTDSAGAMIDRETFFEARNAKLNPQAYLRANDSNTFFSSLNGALIKTGPTGTNVNDIGIAIVRG